MNIISHKSIEVDYCESCKGFWLDAGEVIGLTRQFVALAGRSGVQSEAIRKFIKSLPEELQSIEEWFQSNRNALLHLQKDPKSNLEGSLAKNLGKELYFEAVVHCICALLSLLS